MKKSSVDSGIFDLSDVAAIADITDHTAKNWTMNRPLTITPSIRAGQGSGSRSLYSEEDVFLMTLASRLDEMGLTFKVIKTVIEEFKSKIEIENQQSPRNFRMYDWLVIRLKGENSTIEIYMHGYLPDEISAYRDSDGIALVYIEKIKFWMQDRIRRLDEIKEERKQKAKEEEEKRKGK